MNSNQQGQGSEPSDPQSQSGSQGQQGGQRGKDNAVSGGTGQQSQSGGAGGQPGDREADQRKDFDKLMSQSDQSLRDSTMKQGSDDAQRDGGSGQSR